LHLAPLCFYAFPGDVVSSSAVPTLSDRPFTFLDTTLWDMPSLSGPFPPVMQCSVAAWQRCSVAACALPSIGSQKGGLCLPPFWNLLQPLLPSPLSGRLLARVQPWRRVRDNKLSWPMSGVPSKRRLEATNERRRSSGKYRLWPRRRRGFQSKVSHQSRQLRRGRQDRTRLCNQEED
jgi:hypothetical protein